MTWCHRLGSSQTSPERKLRLVLVESHDVLREFYR
jgi:hypothetical protein